MIYESENLKILIFFQEKLIQKSWPNAIFATTILAKMAPLVGPCPIEIMNADVPQDFTAKIAMPL